ncbi:MAG TPA: DUF58 domain-containing protein, partial [Roseiflexaceae bacterium]|nr:DUF58 domain-containing protein [Roseiflexaceae bacterium]
MIPTFRLLLLLLLGSLLVAGVALDPRMLWLAIAYLVALAVLVATDAFVCVRPSEIDIERINDSRLSIGADNLITILIANRSRRPLQFQLRDEYPYQFLCTKPFLHGKIGAYELHETKYYVRPLQRGDYAFGDINIRYDSPLKTFVRQIRCPAGAAVKVYPNVLDIRKYDLLARKGMLLEIGLRASRLFGLGTEFERLREYNPDDEFRRINWKATARRGKPIAAEYETERSQYVVNLIDTGRLMRPPVGVVEDTPGSGLAKLDYVINAALLLTYVVTLKGDHVGMLTFADDVRTYLAPRRGKGQFYRMLEALYNVQLEPVEADYSRALTYLGTRHKRRSLVIVYTDLVTLDAARPLIAHLARMARRHLPLCVLISDPDVARIAAAAPSDSGSIYQRAVAEMLLDERRIIRDTLHRSG